MKKNLTKAQHQALSWLYAKTGSGVFTKTQQLLAAGEVGPFMRSTWNMLESKGYVAFLRMKNNKHIIRCGITIKGYSYLSTFGTTPLSELPDESV